MDLRQLEQNLAACAKPASRWSSSRFRPGQDEALARIARPLAVCADESAHDRASLEGLRARYDAVNIKLDKTGGLTRHWRWPMRRVLWDFKS
jgi:L-alanine-DL-glutamate epimerase and related enzymes of enolase superfamily